MSRDVTRAEGVGFEPTETGYASTVFKTVAFGRSAIPPCRMHAPDRITLPGGLH